MAKKLTVIIPCYNQLPLARRSLDQLKKQTFKDFSVVLLDDKSKDDYSLLVNEFPELDIIYSRNDSNLGAIKNIYKSIYYLTQSKYKISLHEDDILHYQYFEIAIKVLDEKEDVLFLGTEGVWFSNNIQNNLTQVENSYSVLDRHELGQYFIKSNRLIFGSIIYRNILPSIEFNLSRYSVLCDRPFLLDIIRSSKAVIMKSSFIFVRDHGKHDNRGDSIKPNHLFNLYEDYKQFFNQDNESKRYFMQKSTNDLFLTCSSIPKVSLFDFIKKGSRLDLIKLKYINHKGICGLILYLIKR